MRRDYGWFEKRAAPIWQAMPGRSFLLIIPDGSDEAAVADAIAGWTKEKFRLPPGCTNHRLVVVRITPDGVTSSEHFLRKLRVEMARHTKEMFADDVDGYPSDALEALVDEARAKGIYPIIVIERFHAFARIADNNLLSVLSVLRTLEHRSEITTLAISPIDYDAIRRRMAPGLPFVNSVYGDNHDRAVMTPLTREEFVATGISRGLSPARANQLFALGGGPDAIYRSLIDAATNGEEDIIEESLSRLGDTIKGF